MPGSRFFLANRTSGLAGRDFRETSYIHQGRTEPWPGLSALDQLAISECRGKQAVLDLAPRLRELALRCGQGGLIDHLGYYLSVPYFGSKLPCVLLFHADRAEAYPDARSQGAWVAAVVLHEYRLAGVRSGAYIPADSAGDWTILAPPEVRERIAQRAATHLLQHGAALVLLSSARSGNTSAALPEPSAYSPVATSERSMLRTLPLARTLDETLARMGSHTRRNLRLARRRAIVQLQAAFVAESPISEAAFLEINREGFYPVPDAVARWRFRSVHETPSGFLAGVCTGEGVWLALLGGRRFQGADGLCTAVDWQLNRTSFARHSPGSLIRSFLIEHEIAKGTAYLRFEGGTPHSMRSAFVPEIAKEWLYARPRLTPGLLRALGKVLPKGNLLADFLNSSEMHWWDRKAFPMTRPAGGD